MTVPEAWDHVTLKGERGQTIDKDGVGQGRGSVEVILGMAIGYLGGQLSFRRRGESRFRLGTHGGKQDTRARGKRPYWDVL